MSDEDKYLRRWELPPCYHHLLPSESRLSSVPCQPKAKTEDGAADAKIDGAKMNESIDSAARSVGYEGARGNRFTKEEV